MSVIELLLGLIIGSTAFVGFAAVVLNFSDIIDFFETKLRRRA